MFSKETYHQRRIELQGRIEGGLLLFLGNSESPMNFADNCFPFRQDSSFLYYFGLDQPDLAAVIDVDGPMFNARDRNGLMSEQNPVSLFIEKIDKAQTDPRVKAIILRINSPGGSVTASDIMYNGLLALREKRNLPVVAIFEDVGASGAYYIACAADRILAHPTSVGDLAHRRFSMRGRGHSVSRTRAWQED